MTKNQQTTTKIFKSPIKMSKNNCRKTAKMSKKRAKINKIVKNRP